MDAKPLAEALLTATAQQDAAAARVTAYRDAMTTLARNLWEGQGIKATFPITGLGKAEWLIHDPKPVITDHAAFMRWAEASTEVRITVKPHVAELVEAFLDGHAFTWKREDILRDTDRDALLNRLTATDDGQAVTVDGEVVPGVEWRTEAPNLRVTVEPDRKRDAKAAARAAVEAELDG